MPEYSSLELLSATLEDEEEDGGTYDGTEELLSLLGGFTGCCGCDAAGLLLSLPSAGCSSEFCGTPVKNSSS